MMMIITCMRLNLILTIILLVSSKDNVVDDVEDVEMVVARTSNHKGVSEL